MRLVKYLTFPEIFNSGKNVEKLIIVSEETLQNLYAKAWGSFPMGIIDGRVFVQSRVRSSTQKFKVVS